MKLSVVIPAHNEAEHLPGTVGSVAEALEGRDYEIVVVDDASRDPTAEAVEKLARENGRVRGVTNAGPRGYGMAVRSGLAAATGEAVAVMMADGSDSAADLVRYWQKIEEGYDCVFGSRFMRGGKVVDYPAHKLALNRAANWFIQGLFGLRYDDVTNAFKCYRREALEGIGPLVSQHFNLTVEMPLKAIVRGYRYAVIPITWTNRRHGISKLKIQEMGSRYLFIVLYVWLEKMLARGDYHRGRAGRQARPEAVRLQEEIRAAFDRDAADEEHFPSAIDPRIYHVQLILSFLGDLAGRRVLDVGCGKGRFARVLKERHPEAEVWGLDLSAEMLRYVPPGIRTRQGTMTDLPFEDGWFDAAYATESLEHAVEIEAAVAEMCRVVRPGGRIVIIDKNAEQAGRLKTPPWEKWFDRRELEGLLGRWCREVSSEYISYWEDVEPDGLFLAWKAVR